MVLPQLLYLPTEDGYRDYYENFYCQKCLITFDNIPVYFRKDRFRHAFYESSNRDQNKDIFSSERAERMLWIKATLENPKAEQYQGWDRERKVYTPYRRVSVVYQDYVVILNLTLKSGGIFSAQFNTAYEADRSIVKIRQSPLWRREQLV